MGSVARTVGDYDRLGVSQPESFTVIEYSSSRRCRSATPTMEKRSFWPELGDRG